MSKYIETCLQQRLHFSPFVVSVDGILGVDSEATLKQLAIRLVAKCQQSYYQMCRCVKSRSAITMVRAGNYCIRGLWVPVIHIIVKRIQWEGGAGLNLYK